MPNIKPISDLRNYGEVLRNVTIWSPVFLRKNRHGRYAVLDIEESLPTFPINAVFNPKLAAVHSRFVGAPPEFCSNSLMLFSLLPW